MSDAPPAHRSSRPSRLRTQLDRKKLGVIVAVLAALGIGLGFAFSGGSTPTSQANGAPPASSGILGAFASNICPLTATPAPNGKAPDRPALAVKIGNEPAARPQSGLNEADIVYDTPAEDGVMRYVAVYQCHDATAIGPVRSVRWVDSHIVRQFIHPILTYAGGIIPDVNSIVASHWLENGDLLASASSASYRTTNRVPPDNLYTSTSKMYGYFSTASTAPPPVFQYSKAPPAGAKSVSSIAINYSYGTNIVWKWDGSEFVHYYASGSTLTPDTDALTNKPFTTNNVVVEIVNYTLGPYAESPGATGDVKSQTLGHGPGYLLRNGTVTRITWHRRALIDPDTFTNAKGATVKLAPGRTCVEMVIDTTAKKTGAITITP